MKEIIYIYFLHVKFRWWQYCTKYKRSQLITWQNRSLESMYTRDLNECFWNFKHLWIFLICQWTRKTVSILSEKVRRDPHHRDRTTVKVSQWNFWWGLPRTAVSYRQQLISSVFIKPFLRRWWVWPCLQSVENFISILKIQKEVISSIKQFRSIE